MDDGSINRDRCLLVVYYFKDFLLLMCLLFLQRPSALVNAYLLCLPAISCSLHHPFLNMCVGKNSYINKIHVTFSLLPETLHRPYSCAFSRNL